MNKTYLGDSVYADFDGFHVVLTTENGYADDPRNKIAMEPEGLAALDTWRVALMKENEADKGPAPAIAESSAFGAALKRAADYAKAHTDAIAKGGARLARIAGQLSESVDFNPYGGTFWFTVSNRADVQVLMQLAPGWDKKTWDGGIDYDAEVDGVCYKIRAADGALPPTCKLVEKEVEIPAQPARIEKRMVIECATLEATA